MIQSALAQIVRARREAKEEEEKRKDTVLKLKEQEIHEHHVKVGKAGVCRAISPQECSRTCTMTSRRMLR